MEKIRSSERRAFHAGGLHSAVTQTNREANSISTYEGELTGQAEPPAEPLTLWYRRPARQWVEALPVGNGRLGAMIFGGIVNERLQLNEDTLMEAGRMIRIPNLWRLCPKSADWSSKAGIVMRTS